MRRAQLFLALVLCLLPGCTWIKGVVDTVTGTPDSCLSTIPPGPTLDRVVSALSGLPQCVVSEGYYLVDRKSEIEALGRRAKAASGSNPSAYEALGEQWRLVKARVLAGVDIGSTAASRTELDSLKTQLDSTIRVFHTTVSGASQESFDLTPVGFAYELLRNLSEEKRQKFKSFVAGLDVAGWSSL